jgi:cytochrome P450
MNSALVVKSAYAKVLTFLQTIVQISRLVAARSPTNFRNPDSFIPERWISSEYDSDNKAATQPFSLGPRNCIGKKYVFFLGGICLYTYSADSLAYHEIRLILAMVLYHFDLNLCEESKTWIDHKVFMFWEKPPLMVTLTPHLG